LFGRAQIVAGDHDPVGVRMAVQVHELGLFEGGLDGVLAAGLVGWVPVSDCRSSGDVQGLAFFGELGVIEAVSRFLFTGVDFALPAGYGNAAAFDCVGSVLSGRQKRRWDCGDDKCGKSV